ncbi:MAG: zinc ribbon domain-containing protein [Nanoarchaeota archaeon]|nr:zinc ribbon domain-containing protein [Nanoarchaeota archaeon]
MFNKKKCRKCGEKLNKSFDYCPSCGLKIGEEEDWGMLGKNDFVPEQDPFSQLFSGGMGGKMFNRMLSGAMKMIEREMQKNMKEAKSIEKQVPLKTNFELYVNGKRISPENIKITRKIPTQDKPSVKKMPKNTWDNDTIKRFSDLPKKEPKTNVRRLSNKVIYELEVPGVKEAKDISIVKLENSIEIKAISEKHAYKKLIAIDLPISKYVLEKGKLILELGVKE